MTQKPKTKTSKKKVKIVNVRIPKELILFLESLVEKGVYKTKSEAIREFVRDYVNKRRDEI